MGIVVMGVVLILWGLSIYFVPVSYSGKWGMTFDYSGIENYVRGCK